MGHDREHHGQSHRTQAHRVDVVKVSAAELHALGAQAQRLADDQVRDQRAHPGDGHVGVQAQHALERAEDAQRHEQHGDDDVEHQPDHAARVAAREPREEVAPCQ